MEEQGTVNALVVGSSPTFTALDRKGTRLYLLQTGGNVLHAALMSGGVTKHGLQEQRPV